MSSCEERSGGVVPVFGSSATWPATVYSVLVLERGTEVMAEYNGLGAPSAGGSIVVTGIVDLYTLVLRAFI